MFSRKRKKSEGFVPSWLREAPRNLDPEAPVRLQEEESDRQPWRMTHFRLWRGPLLGLVRRISAGLSFRFRIRRRRRRRSG